MNTIHISGMDLNLLLVFDTLMTERNATRAAERLGLTQPAVSHALGRLRALLDDPLFVRTPGGMTPTPAAEALALDIRPALRRIESALGNHEEFFPATSSRQFVIGLSDYASVVLLPSLLEALKKEAPSVSLIVKSTGHEKGLRQLEEGEVALLVGNFPPPPPHMEEQLLYRDGFVCAARVNHPAFRKTLTLKRYVSMEHVQVSTRGEPHGAVDAVLDASGVARKVVITVGHFLIAPLLLQSTDLLATEPCRLLTPLAKQFNLALKTPPFSIPPFNVTQIWHSRHTADAAHVWLRKMIVKCVQHVAGSVF